MTSTHHKRFELMLIAGFFVFVAHLDFNICTYCKKGKSVRVNYRSDTMFCVIKAGTDHRDAKSLRQTPLLLAYWSKKKKSKGYLLDKHSRDHVYSREAVVTNETLSRRMYFGMVVVVVLVEGDKWWWWW